MNHAGRPWSVAVLAGGEARRMGGAKVELEVGGRSLLDRALQTARQLSDDVLLLSGTRLLTRPDARTVADWDVGGGPLTALGAALEAARQPWLVLLAADMPFVAPAIVEALARAVIDAPKAGGIDEPTGPATRLSDAGAAASPGRPSALRSEWGWEPFPGLYHRDLLPALRQHLDGGGRSMAGFLDSAGAVPLAVERWRPLDPALRFLDNVNTPEDLLRVRKGASS